MKKKTLTEGFLSGSIKARTNNKLNPHKTLDPGFKLGPHCYEASALPTALLKSHHTRAVPIAFSFTSSHYVFFLLKDVAS